MPNQVHLLISESAKGKPSVVLKVLKQRVSRDLRRSRRRAPAGQSSCAFTTGDGNLPRFWQTRFYDFNVWSEKKVREKLEYMHANPMTRKLVEHPEDWPWSSWSFYAKGEAGVGPNGLGSREKQRTPRTKNPHAKPPRGPPQNSPAQSPGPPRAKTPLCGRFSAVGGWC